MLLSNHGVDSIGIVRAANYHSADDWGGSWEWGTG